MDPNETPDEAQTPDAAGDASPERPDPPAGAEAPTEAVDTPPPAPGEGPTEILNNIRPPADDAPTQILSESFPPAGEAPTQILGGTAGAEPVPAEDKPRGKGLLITLISIAAVLLIAGAVALGMLLFGGGGAPEPEPAPTDASEPGEPAAPAVIETFTAEPATVECTDDSSGTTAPVLLGWTVADADRIALAQSTQQIDALNESSADNLSAEQAGYDGLPYDCTQPSLVYTLTAANADDERTSSFVVVTRTVLPPPPPAVAAPQITDVRWSDGLDYATCPSVHDSLSTEKGITWTSTPNVNSVSLIYVIDVNYPYPENDYPVITGLPANGSYPIQVYCGHDGSVTFEVIVIAENSSGKAERTIRGNTAT